MIANPNDGNSPRVEVATPMIDVSAGGLITATTEQEKGYVPGGTKSATQQLTTQGAKTVTPGTTAQTAVASGRYTTGDVVVSGDANLVPENIAEGVSIFGVTGTHSGAGGVEWIKYSAPSFRAPPTAFYSQVNIPVASNVSGVLLYVNAAIPVAVPYSMIVLRPHDASLEGPLINGTELVIGQFPFAINEDGGSGSIYVTNNTITFYAVIDAIGYLYYSYLPIFSG